MTELTKDNLRFLESVLPGNKYIEIKDGVAFKVSDDSVIPKNLLPTYYTPVENGFYQLCERTCGGESGCKVGSPLIDTCDGFSSKTHCGVYTTDKIDMHSSIRLTESQLINIINTRADSQVIVDKDKRIAELEAQLTKQAEGL